MFAQQIINGLTLGSIYALFALGYTMVYGVLLMINFAHSEIFMVGAYIGFFILALLPGILPPIIPLYFLIIFGFALLFTGVLAVAVEKMAYRPLRHAPRLAPLISAIGVSIFLQNLVMLAVGAESKPYPETFGVAQFEFSGLHVNSHQILIFTLSIVLMVALQLFITRTRMGKAMRAVAQNHIVSQLMGINTNTVIAVTFFIGGGLGGVAGVLNGLYYGSIKYNMGFLPGIKAFTAAVLGGIGNIKGAMVGGFALGILEALSAGYISSEYKDVIAFVVLILVLVFRPTGIFGEEVAEKI
ncbi:MAG: branched-chain amino acid ABC transporter permease [candidate division Zixibacteria bacterium]|nr:branched-chain amino acid ABC transporter permease [candidate division Zixibacteria bacterium]